MIPGGLVQSYGLRACPLSCAGICKRVTQKSDGTVREAEDCLLMTGPAPRPGSMPPLTHHAVDQLRAMAAPGRDADQDVARAAQAELRRRGL